MSANLIRPCSVEPDAGPGKSLLVVLGFVIAVAAPVIAVEMPRSWTVATARFTEFRVSSQLMYGITAGPDGNLWFTEVGHIGRITPAGVITEFPTPRGVQPGIRITSGPDGNVWFTATSGVGRVTPTGVMSVFDPGIFTLTHGIAGGPDGNIWVTDELVGGVGQTPPTSGIARITPTGTFTQFDVENFEGAITAGRDGALWFTDRLSPRIGRITTDGVITYFDTPPGTRPSTIAAATDGSIWFDEYGLERLARRDPSGSITEWHLRAGALFPIVGPDQKIWFWMKDAIGSISSDGAVTEIRVPAPFRVNVIAAGPDGNIWFSDLENRSIGRLDVSSITPVPAIPTLSPFALCLLAASLCLTALFALAPARMS